MESYSEQQALEDAEAIIYLRDMHVVTEKECNERLQTIRTRIGLPWLDKFPVLKGG